MKPYLKYLKTYPHISDKTIRKRYIRQITGQTVIQALESLDQGGNLIMDRAIQRLKRQHGCNANYTEVREALNQLAENLREVLTCQR